MKKYSQFPCCFSKLWFGVVNRLVKVYFADHQRFYLLFQLDDAEYIREAGDRIEQ